MTSGVLAPNPSTTLCRPARPRVGRRTRPFGAWLDISAGWPALLLVPEMRGAKERRFTIEVYPAIGEVVEARIVSLGERGEIALSQHPQADA